MRKGALAVGVRGTDAIVLGVEKKAVAKLQVSQTVRKIAEIDEHICLAFAGLTADARVLINKARTEAQSHRRASCGVIACVRRTLPCGRRRRSFLGGRPPSPAAFRLGPRRRVPALPSPSQPLSPLLQPVPLFLTAAPGPGRRLTLDEPPSVEHMTRFVASTQQKYTQSGGVRPFGISTLIVGFDGAGAPALYQTDPSGTYSAWKAAAIGRNSKTVREYLEKHYAPSTGRATLLLALRALAEVVDASSKNLEMAVVEAGRGLRFLDDAELDGLVAEFEAEKAAAIGGAAPPARPPPSAGLAGEGVADPGSAPP